MTPTSPAAANPLPRALCLAALLCGAVGLSPTAAATEPATIAGEAKDRIEQARTRYESRIRELRASREALLRDAKSSAELLGEARVAYRQCRAEKVLVCMEELLASSDENLHVARFAATLLAKDFALNQALAAMVNETSMAVRDALETLQLLGPLAADGERSERELMNRLFTAKLFDELTEEALQGGGLRETTRVELGTRLVEVLESLSAPPDPAQDARVHLRAQLEELGLAALGLGILRQREAQFIAADWRALIAVAKARRFRLAGMEQPDRFAPGVTVYPFPPTDGSRYRRSVIDRISDYPGAAPASGASSDQPRRRGLLVVDDMEHGAPRRLQSAESTTSTLRR